MKASFVSSYAVSTALRHQLMTMQADLAKAQKEATSFLVADTGLALGGQTGKAVSLQRDFDRLKGIQDSNGLVAGRLSEMQAALEEMRVKAQSFFTTMTAASSSQHSTVTVADAKATLQAMTSLINTNVDGQYLFAGVSSDVKPLDDFFAPGSQARAAFDTAFQGYFGFAADDAAASGITGAQMNDFMTSVVEPLFLGAGWAGNWSEASDQPVVSRIALNETVENGTNANIDGIRRLAMATAAVSALFTDTMSEEAKEAVVGKAVGYVSQSIGDITAEQARLGVLEGRVARADERLQAQMDLFEGSLLDLKEVDPYEAASRVSTLLAQIEASYELTARIRELSLVRYL